MNEPNKEKTMDKNLLTYQPGYMKTYLGNYVNLQEPDPKTIHIGDVAWGLGRIIRFNGHIGADYTVAHHCLVMSHYVPEEYALEALLHDAAEAYIGDIIWPVKALLDGQLDNAVSNFENRFLYKMAQGLDLELPNDGDGMYVKSDVVKAADIKMGQQEWAMLERGDEFQADDEMTALFEYVNERYHEDYMQYGQPWWAYLRRFHELTNTEYVYEDYVKLFFPNPEPDPTVAEEFALRESYDSKLKEEGREPMSDEEWESLMEKAEGYARELFAHADAKEAVNDQ